MDIKHKKQHEKAKASLIFFKYFYCKIKNTCMLTHLAISLSFIFCVQKGPLTFGIRHWKSNSKMNTRIFHFMFLIDWAGIKLNNIQVTSYFPRRKIIYSEARVQQLWILTVKLVFCYYFAFKSFITERFIFRFLIK